jgi:hypothetical protein
MGALLVVALFFSIPGMLTRASVADFYPSICLGTWQNSDRAQGRPESWGSTSDLITDEFTATFSLGMSSLFCGEFVPPSFDAENVASVERVGLTIVWHVGALPSSVLSNNIDEFQSVVVPPDNAGTQSEITTPEGPEVPFLPPEPPLPLEFPQEAPSNSLREPSRVPELPPTTLPDQPAIEMFPAASGALPLTALSILTPVMTVHAEEESPSVVAEPPPAEIPPVADFVPPIVFQEAPPLLELQGEISASSGEPTAVAEFPLSFEELSAPPVSAASNSGSSETVPDEHFLKVTYSTDGRTWFEAGKVTLENWDRFTVTIPVRTIEELEHLKIGIEPLRTTVNPFPPVYLDGMFLEVHYTQSLSITDLVAEKAEPAPEEVSRIVTTIPSSEPLLDTEFSVGGAQTCSLEPFSVSITRGGGMTHQLIQRVPAFSNAPFQLLTGKLPTGVAAVFTPSFGMGDTLASVSFSAGAEAVPGSYTLIIAYRELSPEGRVSTATCQANLVVE